MPDLTRPDVGLVWASEWHVGSAEAQRRAADAAMTAWDGAPWPEGLLSHTVLLSTDGTSVAHYSQWTGRDAVTAFRRTDPPGRVDGILAAVPEIDRRQLVEYELYRSMSTRDEGRVPGCVVLVEVEFDGPDPARQRAWIDAVFEALETDPHPPSGGISGHFHVSTDGTRVLNFAEWESEQAHIDALAAPGDGVGSGGSRWHRVQNYPGLLRSRVTRYRYHRARRPADIT